MTALFTKAMFASRISTWCDHGHGSCDECIKVIPLEVAVLAVEKLKKYLVVEERSKDRFNQGYECAQDEIMIQVRRIFGEVEKK